MRIERDIKVRHSQTRIFLEVVGSDAATGITESIHGNREQPRLKILHGWSEFSILEDKSFT
jgi:hypothetical protein